MPHTLLVHVCRFAAFVLYADKHATLQMFFAIYFYASRSCHYFINAFTREREIGMLQGVA